MSYRLARHDEVPTSSARTAPSGVAEPAAANSLLIPPADVTLRRMPQAAPYGAWRSPIAAASVAAGEVPLGRTDIVGQDCYWLEGKPREGGRIVLVRQDAAGGRTELTPAGFNVRTRVHEYGGGAYTVAGTSVCFVNFTDQRLYRQD